MFKEASIKMDSFEIYYLISEVEGLGTPLIFLHGLGSAGTDFAGAAEVKELQVRTVVIPDLIGFGKSSKPYDFSYDLAEQAVVLDRFIERLGFGKIDIAAHSMGGVIAIIFAKLHPDKVNKLIAAEPNLISENATISAAIKSYGSEEAFKENFESYVSRFNKADKPAAQRFYGTLTMSNYYALFRSANSIIDRTKAPFYSEFLKMKTKRYFIRGEKSYLAFAGKMEEEFTAVNLLCIFYLLFVKYI